jgi:hypothetical protein
MPLNNTLHYGMLTACAFILAACGRSDCVIPPPAFDAAPQTASSGSCTIGWAELPIQDDGTFQALLAIWADSRSIVAVGMADAVLGFDGAAWKMEQIASTWTYLSDIWGTSSKELFVTGANSRILQYDSSGWNVTHTGPTSGTSYHGVFGLGHNSVYAVGGDYSAGNGSPLVAHYDGKTWADITTGISGVTFLKVWASDDHNVYAVGLDTASKGVPGISGLPGVIYKWNGQTWSKESIPSVGSLRGIWGTDADNIITVGTSGAILRRVHGVWQQEHAGSEGFSAVHGTSMDNIYIAASAPGSTTGSGVYGPASILHWDGSKWHTSLSASVDHFADIWAVSRNNVYAIARKMRPLGKPDTYDYAPAVYQYACH